jgi:hypothetical protein
MGGITRVTRSQKPKKAYKAPRLIKYGSVAKLTAVKSPVTPESSGFKHGVG